MNASGDRIIGIDIGSVSLSVAELMPDGQTGRFRTVAHGSEVKKHLLIVLDELGPCAPSSLAVTTSSPARLRAARRVDNLVAAIRAAKHLHPDLGSLMLVGGERFSLSIFDKQGKYRDSRFNSLCAAGTGSFLDQQAERLGLKDSAELAATALEAEGEIPRIATRCAVFAKTDLIHSQQEGYGLPAICDGLCRGLAANVHDTLFCGQPAPQPIVLAGGVAKNGAVVRHLSELVGHELLVDEYAQVYGALGAALDMAQAMADGRETGSRAEPLPAGQLWDESPGTGKKNTYPPLRLQYSSFPRRWSLESYLFEPRLAHTKRPVEVDTYRRAGKQDSLRAFMGIDIGSTSTKAVLLDESAEVTGEEDGDRPAVWAGFYTRTSGRPLLAVQALFEAALDWAKRTGIELRIGAVGTTGSGRKFAGAIVGADLVLDEITAHARAATAIDPQVDTIIEIGGQDAKFTTLTGGMVTQSFMNHVCAAGTGSFIEEQAQRLGCALEDMAARTEGRRAPLASDRCTVFMERDINHFLTEGYEVDEVLCAALHAVRENYLLKVAREGVIGDRIFFQGATAKNRSLVAAFEQKLKKPLTVSRYCHLTGALGVALHVRDMAREEGFESGFRGLDLCAEPIEVRSEVCGLCKNHCKLRLAEVGGKTVAYGFLCGRDYDVEHFVSSNKSGFDLLKARRKHFAVKPVSPRLPVTVGLPAALHMVEDLPFWKIFFAELGAGVVTSEGLSDAVTTGKRLAGAEFCAPVSAWHAHVASLAGRADYIFAPFYLEAEHERGTRRQFCYYTQFAPALIKTMQVKGLSERCISPLLHIGERQFEGFGRLTEALRPALGNELTRARVQQAFQRAERAHERQKESWPAVMQRQLENNDDIAVVLLGRPYTLWPAEMNKGIADILAAQGVKTFGQDMIEPDDLGQVGELITKVHWYHAKHILAAAEMVGRAPDLYPVLLTSFKCGPDACTIEYFRRIMNAHDKPYLVLQLDEHDSQVGYETRIEAAVRSFRHHRSGVRSREKRHSLPLVPDYTRQIEDRTLLVPAWDSLASPLFVAALQHQGIDARLIKETPELVQGSLGYNTGQCIPLNIITHEFMRSVESEGLDPERCALWMPKSSIGCNIGFFPQYAKSLLESHGNGFERSKVYAGEISAGEISIRAGLDACFAFLFAGMLRRMSCMVRPYEVHPGETDRARIAGMQTFSEAIAGRLNKIEAARRVVESFLAIETEGPPRPKVAIFGDLYVRDNDIMNQDLIRVIEAHGAEALTTPYTEYTRIIAVPYLRKWFREGNYKDVALSMPLLLGLELIQRRFNREFSRVVGKTRVRRSYGKPEELIARFGVSMYHTGESFDNLLKIFHLLQRHPDLALFVQTNPAFCCPSIVTEAMAADIERECGVPVVTVTYDGTASQKNDLVVPYLELSASTKRASTATAPWPSRRTISGFTSS